VLALWSSKAPPSEMDIVHESSQLSGCRDEWFRSRPLEIILRTAEEWTSCSILKKMLEASTSQYRNFWTPTQVNQRGWDKIAGLLIPGGTLRMAREESILWNSRLISSAPLAQSYTFITKENHSLDLTSLLFTSKSKKTLYATDPSQLKMPGKDSHCQVHSLNSNYTMWG
jgi:hypothetical protein